MQDIRGPMRGIWLPLVTPMRDGEIDAASIRRLAAHYASEPIDGVIVAATTGEGLALSPDETRMLAFEVREAFDAASRRMPVWLGMAGADTRAVAARLESSADWPVDGYLVSCPFYVRPSQEGLKLHFSALAGATDRPLAVYNIPYRTGVNIDNATLFALAGEHRNIRAVKDCSALPAQSAELAAARPGGFSVMTGEDAAFFDALCHGADGGILASAHIRTGDFARVQRLVEAGGVSMGLGEWSKLLPTIRMLFSEPSPAALKHWLWRQGLIASAEMRLPMVPASQNLRARIDAEIAMPMEKAG